MNPPKVRLPGNDVLSPQFGEGGCPFEPGRVRESYCAAGVVWVSLWLLVLTKGALLNLNSRHRELLRQGVIQWGGPARCTDDIARVIGYSNSREFYEDQDRLVELVSSQKRIEDLDFRRLVLATEIVFVSDLLGAGVEWETVWGLSDEETLVLLREMQRGFIAFPNSRDYPTNQSALN